MEDMEFDKFIKPLENSLGSKSHFSNEMYQKCIIYLRVLYFCFRNSGFYIEFIIYLMKRNGNSGFVLFNLFIIRVFLNDVINWT